MEKISEMNYDERLHELESKLAENKQEKITDNIISFEALRERKKKKSFNIKENIMYEDLEKLSTYIIDLNSEMPERGIMIN